jgi:type VI secretion system secreted protein VgrG
MRVPRVGEEVYVVWENGDPDRPVVIASSYPLADETLFDPDADPLPVVHRQAFPDGTMTNEVRFESAAGKELLAVEAGKDALVRTGGRFDEDVGGERQSVVEKNSVSLVKGRSVEVVKKQKLTRSNKAMALSAGKTLLLRSGKQVVIQAPEVVLLASGSSIRISASGVEIEGKPFTRINCGGGASGEAEPKAEEPKHLPKPKAPLLLPKPKQPLLLPKPRS